MRALNFSDDDFARCVERTAMAVVTALLGLGCGAFDAELERPAEPTLGCQTLPALSTEPFAAASDFGEFESGSLYQWKPQDQWFVSGIDDPSPTMVTASRHPSMPAASTSPTCSAAC